MDQDSIVTVMIVILFTTVSLLFGAWIGSTSLEQQAIKHKCAIYAPDTGNFTWKENK